MSVLKPQRIEQQLHNTWKPPENSVWVGANSQWANPFHWRKMKGHYPTQQKRRAVMEFMKLASSPEYSEWRDRVRAELKGKNLVVDCKPGEMSHADVLLNIANYTTRLPNGGNEVKIIEYPEPKNRVRCCWHRVGESIPEISPNWAGDPYCYQSNDVLVMVETGRMMVGYFVFYHDDPDYVEGWHKTGRDMYDIPNPTHWAHLPQSPFDQLGEVK